MLLACQRYEAQYQCLMFRYAEFLDNRSNIEKKYTHAVIKSLSC